MSVSSFKGDAAGQVTAVACGEREFESDIVIVGVGIMPETTLAAAAGLRCENGIWVDESCRTSDPNVYAAGDCTNHPSVHYGRRIRLESVDNAVEQGRVAAASICGKDVRHDHVPWFWSDQYDVKLQIAGLSQGHDRIVMRGDRTAGAATRGICKCRPVPSIDLCEDRGRLLHPAEVVVGLAIRRAEFYLRHPSTGELFRQVVGAGPGD